MATQTAKIGIIGGSGLYEMDGLTGVEFVDIETPFGSPSDSIAIGDLSGIPVAFLPRHGRGHRISPTNLPSHANIYALKTLGVERIVSISAVGSLKEELEPLHLVVPDQLIDRTRNRVNTFFNEGMAGHITFADPFCAPSSKIVYEGAVEIGIDVHQGGTLVVMEGPAFSTRAESFMYRSWGGDLIGMTALPEAKLAREAEICYATMAWVTDYDCWHEEEEDVTVEMIIGNLLKNVAASKELLRRIIPRLDVERDCPCGSALADALVTAPDLVPEEIKRKLEPITGRYWS